LRPIHKSSLGREQAVSLRRCSIQQGVGVQSGGLDFASASHKAPSKAQTAVAKPFLVEMGVD
jgi:hypothetical protein